MKSILKLAFAGILAVASLNSCSKKSSTTSSRHMDATVNGGGFHVVNCTATQNGTQLQITGLQPNVAVDGMPNISMNIVNYTGAGTYTIASGGTSANYLGSMVSSSIAVSGTINITAVNPITGTFSFTCNDGTKVTNGNFVAQ